MDLNIFIMFWGIFLVALTAAQGETFFNGLIQGLRLSTVSKSNCLISIESTQYARKEFVDSMTSSTSSISGRLHKFQSMVNLFTNSATICKIQSLTDNIQKFFTSLRQYLDGQYDGYAIYLTTKLTEITNYWNKFQSSELPYDRGYYFAKTFSLVFRYNI
jgi:hypothetical protein